MEQIQFGDFAAISAPGANVDKASDGASGDAFNAIFSLPAQQVSTSTQTMQPLPVGEIALPWLKGGAINIVLPQAFGVAEDEVVAAASTDALPILQDAPVETSVETPTLPKSSTVDSHLSTVATEEVAPAAQMLLAKQKTTAEYAPIAVSHTETDPEEDTTSANPIKRAPATTPEKTENGTEAAFIVAPLSQPALLPPMQRIGAAFTIEDATSNQTPASAPVVETTVVETSAHPVVSQKGFDVIASEGLISPKESAVGQSTESRDAPLKVATRDPIEEPRAQLQTMAPPALNQGTVTNAQSSSTDQPEIALIPTPIATSAYSNRPDDIQTDQQSTQRFSVTPVAKQESADIPVVATSTQDVKVESSVPKENVITALTKPVQSNAEPQSTNPATNLQRTSPTTKDDEPLIAATDLQQTSPSTKDGEPRIAAADLQQTSPSTKDGEPRIAAAEPISKPELTEKQRSPSIDKTEPVEAIVPQINQPQTAERVFEALAARELGAVDIATLQTTTVGDRRTALDGQLTPSLHHIDTSRADIARSVGQQLATSLAMQSDRPVELTLSPEELGRVRLSMHPTDQSMVVMVQADRQDTLDLMRKHIESLSREFREMGYSDVSFSFSQNPNQEQAAQQSATNSDTLTSDAPVSAREATSQLQPLRISLDSDGSSLDLRI